MVGGKSPQFFFDIMRIYCVSVATQTAETYEFPSPSM